MTTETPDNNNNAARQVARACHKATLATLDKNGWPYASLITLALDHDLSAILYVSTMSAHTRNMQADARVALLFDGTEGHPNPQTGPRLSVQGNATLITDDTEKARLRRRFLARNPAAAEYTTFTDFGLWKITPARAQFVGGFGRAQWLAPPFDLNETVITTLREREHELLSQLAAAGRPDVVALDPDGYDVMAGESWTRVAFDAPITDVAEVLKRVGA